MKSKNIESQAEKRVKQRNNQEEGVLYRFLNVKGFNMGYLSVLYFFRHEKSQLEGEKKEKKKGEE